MPPATRKNQPFALSSTNSSLFLLLCCAIVALYYIDSKNALSNLTFLCLRERFSCDDISQVKLSSRFELSKSIFQKSF